jgi:hypothetical protein
VIRPPKTARKLRLFHLFIIGTLLDLEDCPTALKVDKDFPESIYLHH